MLEVWGPGPFYNKTTQNLARVRYNHIHMALFP